MMSVYKIVDSAGRFCFIFAKSRTEAIRKYCSETGMSEAWFNAHCKIKRLGRVE